MSDEAMRRSKENEFFRKLLRGKEARAAGIDGDGVCGFECGAGDTRLFA
jgi:hypothetical protein